MEDKIQKILELSEKTHENTSRKGGWYIKVLHAFEKLIIPLMLGVLAYAANSASNKISQSQLELSNAQLSLAQAEAARNDQRHRDEVKARYIEIFITEVNSQDEARQKIALLALNSVDNVLAQQMSSILEASNQVTKSVGENITRIRQTARGTAVASATGKSGRWKSYEVCASIPDGASMDQATAKSRVISGVGPGSWGDWDGDFRFVTDSQVCRSFAHQIHDQDRLLEITVEYVITQKS